MSEWQGTKERTAQAFRQEPLWDLLGVQPGREFRADLHAHTTLSDGSDSFLELMGKARVRGVTHLAVTNHDTTVGLDAIRQQAAEHGFSVVCGVEVSAWDSAVKRRVHLLGLGMPADAPADRGVRLQALARADEGFLLGMAYSTQRGFGAVHPFTGELRRGWVEVSFFSEELGFDVVIGEIELTECETVSRYTGTARPPCFTRGYGLVFGNNERKALSMSITDRALRAKELDEPVVGPAQNPEFVLLHGDNVDASGFVQHIKLPHYVDFQADLSLIRGLRAKRQNDKDI